MTKDAISNMFSWENPDSRTRVSEGETGQEVMHDVREVVVEGRD